MAEVVHEAQQEFWRPPRALKVPEAVVVCDPVPVMAEACPRCHTEFMIGSRFCHACGVTRPEKDGSPGSAARAVRPDLLAQKFTWWLQSATAELSRRKATLPAWLRYLHFHEIKRWIGLPTPSLIAFFIGVGCVLGAIGVSIFFKPSNLGEFQAIQMWRIEWLLGATASFVAGILLKKPDGD
jgi:hypothetical protein